MVPLDQVAFFAFTMSSRNQDIRAADEYQAPSWGRQAAPVGVEDAGAVPTSPFFTSKESAEAMQWANSQEGTDAEVAVDDEPLTPEIGRAHV